jgi:hypothetical protein
VHPSESLQSGTSEHYHHPELVPLKMHARFRQRSALQRLRALAVLSDALAGEGAGWGPTVLGARRPATAGEWSEVLGLASELRLAPALWCSVHDTRARIPLEVREQLYESHLLNVARNLGLRRSLTAAVSSLNESGIVPLLLKGAVRLFDGTPGAAGHIWMMDLDLVVPGDRAIAAEAALVRAGYSADPGKPFLHPHELPFFSEHSPGPIELHVELGSPPIPSLLPAREGWAQSSRLSVGGAEARILSPTHQVLHSIMHSAVQDLNHVVAGLPLRRLLSLSELVRIHGPRIDWDAIRRPMDDHGLGRHLRGHLWLAHRLTGMPLPGGSWGVWPRQHELRVLASFALGWPPEVQRNLRFAFGRAYLDSLYHHGNHPLRLGGARTRHALRILRRDGMKALADVRASRR